MGKIIIFEGVDNVGKTTLLNAVAEDLSKKGLIVKKLKFPTDGTLYEDKTHANNIKKMLEDEKSIYNDFEVFRHFAIEQFLDKSKSLDKIKKLQKQCDYLLIDRFVLSMVAYDKLGCHLNKTEYSKTALYSTTNIISKYKDDHNKTIKKTDVVKFFLDIATLLKGSTTFLINSIGNEEFMKAVNEQVTEKRAEDQLDTMCKNNTDLLDSIFSNTVHTDTVVLGQSIVEIKRDKTLSRMLAFSDKKKGLPRIKDALEKTSKYIKDETVKQILGA